MRFLVLLLIFSIGSKEIIGQLNQADLAAQWKDGEYVWSNEKGKDPNQITIHKSADGKAKSVQIDDSWYKPDSKGESTFVRFFETYDGRCLYFTEKSIIFFRHTNNETLVKIHGWWGKEPKSKMKDVIKEDLASGKLLQQQNKLVKATIEGKSIQDIEVKLIPFEGERITSHKLFEIGVITTFSDGSSIKTQNLGGKQEPHEFRFELKGGKKKPLATNELYNSSLFYPFHCEAVEGKYLIVIVKNSFNKREIKSVKFPFVCTEASSEEAKYARSWMKYDQIEYKEVIDGNTSYESIKKKNVFKNGLLDYYNDVKLLKKANGLIKVKIDGLWGFCNAKGEEIIPCKYTKARFFNDGVAYVSRDGKVGFVNEKNVECIPVMYDDACPSMTEGKAGVLLDGKAGYVDINNNLIIPFDWEFAWPFNDGLAAVRKGGKWGMIDKTGKLVLDCQFTTGFSLKSGSAMVYSEDRPDEVAIVTKDLEVKWSKKNTYATTSNNSSGSSRSGEISVYKKSSTFSGDIVCTLRGNKLYKGTSTFSGDVMCTINGGKIYEGTSTFSGDILYTVKGEKIYKKTSTFSGDILITNRNGKLYEGSSTFSGDIIATYTKGSVYDGTSTFSGDILFTIKGNVTNAQLAAIWYYINNGF